MCYGCNLFNKLFPCNKKKIKPPQAASQFHQTTSMKSPFFRPSSPSVSKACSPSSPSWLAAQKLSVLNSSNETTNSNETHQSSELPSKSPAQSLKLISSASKITTSDLTQIYRIPNRQFLTIDQVIHANGFKLGEQIGKGSFATVYKANRVEDPRTLLACKVMNISAMNVKNRVSAKNELFILEKVCHPHVVRLYKHFIIECGTSRSVYIFMQFAENQSLSVYMRNQKVGLNEPMAKRVFTQIVSAVDHMHHQGIAHRDLKMGNILLDKCMNCLVADFGLSRVSYRMSKGGTIMSNHFCGTRPYMAPEILLTKKFHVEYDPFIADVWAIGVILFCVLNRTYPFVDGPRMVERQMEHNVKMKNTSFPVGEDLEDLITRLLDPSVERRITLPKTMVHPWCKDEFRSVQDYVRQYQSHKENVSRFFRPDVSEQGENDNSTVNAANTSEQSKQ